MNEQALAQPCHVYGVVDAAGPADLVVEGLRSEPVRLVRQGTLAAVVSPAPSEGFPPTRSNVLSHQSVLDHVMRSCTVLPMRFGVVAPDAVAVRTLLLEAQASRLQEQLVRVAGKEELVVRGYWREPRIFEDIVAENDDIRALRDALHGEQKRASKAARVRLGRRVDEVLQARREREVSAVLSVLAPLACEHENGKVGAEMMVLDVAFLVDREHRGAFDDAVTALREQFSATLELHYLGPLPPYSFVNITLEANR